MRLVQLRTTDGCPSAVLPIEECVLHFLSGADGSYRVRGEAMQARRLASHMQLLINKPAKECFGRSVRCDRLISLKLAPKLSLLSNQCKQPLAFVEGGSTGHASIADQRLGFGQ